MAIVERKCMKCDEIKPLEDFGRSAKGKYGRRASCKECRNTLGRAYGSRKREEAREQKRRYREEHREELEEQEKLHRENLKEQARQRRKEKEQTPSRQASYAKYRKSEKRKAACRRYYEKKKNDPSFKIRNSVSCQIRSKLRRRRTSKKTLSTFTALPYTVQELVAHLEGHFLPGMSWNNYGKWHVDHITAHSKFYYTSLEDQAFLECWALSNLQPLWAVDNLQKGAS